MQLADIGTDVRRIRQDPDMHSHTHTGILLFGWRKMKVVVWWWTQVTVPQAAARRKRGRATPIKTHHWHWRYGCLNSHVALPTRPQ